jgi:hypothetical protein
MFSGNNSNNLMRSEAVLMRRSLAVEITFDFGMAAD